MVHTKVYSDMHRCFGDEQHVAFGKRSTASNLVLSNQFIAIEMNKWSQVDVIYGDYSVGFDFKLELYLHGDLLRWFSLF